MDPVNAGTDTITVNALGETATIQVNVTNDEFVLSHGPTPTDDIPLGDVETITLRWEIGNAPQVGETIFFTATRGTFVGLAQDDTNGTGRASVDISSTLT